METMGKKSFLNALSALGMTLTNGLLGIVVTRMVILRFGSDFNGLNSTANQIVNVLLILEGGFSLASNVALFRPLSEGNYDKVNSLLASTADKFHKIGLLFLLCGLGVAAAYTFFVNSALPKELIFSLLLMTVFPAAVNLYFAVTYRVLLQAQQREYVINFIMTLSIACGHLGNMVMIRAGGPMWAVRAITMSCSLSSSLAIVLYVRRKNRRVRFTRETPRAAIRGTGDVMVQKITSVIYASAPIIFLSVSPAGGTALASVYAVYNNVFVMAKSLMHALIDAPRLSLGFLIAKQKREEVWRVFRQYEYVSFLAIFAAFSTAFAQILPFIRLYTRDVADVNYLDGAIALLMSAIVTLEMLHIPSGHLINMAGEFRVSRNFQLTACVSLLLLMVLGGSMRGIYGMLGAVLATAVLLAVLEIGFVHTRFFPKRLGEFFSMLFPVALTGIALGAFEARLSVPQNGYIVFFLQCAALLALNSGALLLVAFATQRETTYFLWRRIRRLLKSER